MSLIDEDIDQERAFAPDLDPGFSPAPGVPAGGGPLTARFRRGRSQEVELVGRVPPHNADAEQAVLSGIFIRPDVLDDVMNLLKEEDFYLEGHRHIFRCCRYLYERRKPIDIVTVAERLQALSLTDKAGGTAYLVELTNNVIIAANAEHYATIVREKAMQRRLIDACVKIIGKAHTWTQDVPTLLEESEQSVFEIAQNITSNEPVHVGTLLNGAMDTMTQLAASKDVVTGVTTGFQQLDRLTAGLQKTDLIIIAARPSMGKTAFGLNIALHAAVRKQVPTAVFSLEMSRQQLLTRMFAALGKVEMGRLRCPGMLNQDDWDSIQTVADDLSNAPLFIDDTPALSTLELRARARRLKSRENLGLVMVDYLQLMRASRRTDSRELEISEISRSLKALAKELDIPVVALAQLNRKLEDRQDKRPILSDLRESGAIEQDADVIMFIYREDVYTHAKPADRPPVGQAEIIIGKQRNGQVGAAELHYHSRYTSFESVEYAARPSEDEAA
ncbi:MAG: replicative DNA helicase [Desulfovibrio sp.]|jgi:replicative DNA helicase|nr:replicative DNA helicase [Desulfovibrio sp.]